jgi:Na+/glutamate symporter
MILRKNRSILTVLHKREGEAGPQIALPHFIVCLVLSLIRRNVISFATKKEKY